MKKPCVMLSAVLLIACLICGCAAPAKDESKQETVSDTPASAEQPAESSEETVNSTEGPSDIVVRDLGVPLGGKYHYNDISIVPWDMAFCNGKLFVGSGDLSVNSGPVQMWYYDTYSGKWELGATLPEEEISRFYIHEGALYCPGADSQESWDWASFYKYEDEWIKYRSIPNASHCFDLAFAEGRIFAAIENEADTVYCYVAVSSNGGKSFSVVPLMREGEKVKRTVFLQDVFAFGGDVYALASEDGKLNLYKYDGEVFEYALSWHGKISQQGMRKYVIQSKAEYNGKFYFTTGRLYECGTDAEPRLIKMPQTGVVQDIYLNDGVLNIMCVSYNGNAYVMTVYRFADEGNKTLEKIFEFEYETTAVSFAADGENYYFGIASQDRNDKNNGRIIHVKVNG